MGSLYSDLSLHVQYTEPILTESVCLMSEVTRGADVSDWHFDNLSGKHLQTLKMMTATNNGHSQNSTHPVNQIPTNYVTPGFKPFSILLTVELLCKEGVENYTSDQNDNLERTCRLVWYFSVVMGYWAGQLSVLYCSVEQVCSAYLLGLAPMNLTR